jgi:hypothetical protein
MLTFGYAQSPSYPRDRASARPVVPDTLSAGCRCAAEPRCYPRARAARRSCPPIWVGRGRHCRRRRARRSVKLIFNSRAGGQMLNVQSARSLRLLQTPAVRRSWPVVVPLGRPGPPLVAQRRVAHAPRSPVCRIVGSAPCRWPVNPATCGPGLDPTSHSVHCWTT